MMTAEFSTRTVQLHNGDELRIERFVPYVGAPLELIRDIYEIALEVHGGLTHWPALADSLYVSRSLAGSFLETGLDVYFTGRIDNRLVAHVGYQTPVDARHLGSLGWVYTEPNYRGLGIGNHLTACALEDFRAQGGQCIQLGTGNPIANRLYLKHGFFDYHGQVMRRIESSQSDEDGDDQAEWMAESMAGFDNTLFADTGPAQVRPVHWGDATQIAMLYAAPHPSFCKDYGEQLFSTPPHRYFSVFASLMVRAEQKQGFLLALESPEKMPGKTPEETLGKMIVGAVNVLPVDPLVQRHSAQLDFLVRPEYQRQAKTLLTAALERARSLPVEILWLAVAGDDEAKKAAARAVGFCHTSTQAGQLRFGERTLDLEHYRLDL